MTFKGLTSVGPPFFLSLASAHGFQNCYSSAYYLVKRKGLLASSCFQHSFFYTYYIFDFLYFMTRILSHL